MFNKIDFIGCVAETLKQKGFKTKKAGEVIDYFKRRSTVYEEGGAAAEDAAMRAMTDTFNEMQFRVNERAKAARKVISVAAATAQRVDEGMNVRTSLFKSVTGIGSDSRGNALGHALVSLLEEDPRFTGINVGSTYRIKRGQYWAAMSGVLDEFSKGAFGMQKGVAHFPNIVRELYGVQTGDRAAAEIAKAYRKTQDLMVDDFNNSGGTIRKLVDFVLPQKDNYVKVGRSKQDWVDKQMQWQDWTKVRFPDGSLIPEADRRGVLEKVWATKATDGATNIDLGAGHGQGRAMGNMLDKHRFLVYKDAESWMANNSTFGDGTVWDVVSGHIDDMAHKTALVTHFGQNPKLAAQTAIKQARKRAGDVLAAGGKDKAYRAVTDFNSVASKFEKMLEVTLRENAMNPHSTVAAVVTGTSHLLTTALLGRATLLAVPGDLLTTTAVRLSNHQSLIGGLDTYLKGVSVGYKDIEALTAQTGYAFDEQVMGTFAAERYTGVATYGPSVTKRIGEVGMRMNGLGRHTSVARGAQHIEMMGYLWRSRETTLENLDTSAMLQHYGITSREWDVVRKNISPFQPRQNVSLLRPLDILNIADADKERIFLKFATMLDAEGRNMVPAATTEAGVTLRGTTRPDTKIGALLHSFGMFKNFPISIFNMYGRRALAAPDTASRVKFLAALGVGMLGTGALGVQMRELSNGRKPMDMSPGNLAFWGKAVMASGGMSIWGDFLFGGNSRGSNFSVTAAGPLAGLASDVVDVTIGSTFKWIDAMDKGDPYGGKWASKLTEFASRYNPLASNWLIGLPLQREVFDQLQRYIDPTGARKRENARVQRQKKAYGNDYYAPPGEHVF